MTFMSSCFLKECKSLGDHVLRDLKFYLEAVYGQSTCFYIVVKSFLGFQVVKLFFSFLHLLTKQLPPSRSLDFDVRPPNDV